MRVIFRLRLWLAELLGAWSVKVNPYEDVISLISSDYEMSKKAEEDLRTPTLDEVLGDVDIDPPYPVDYEKIEKDYEDLIW